MAKSRWVCHRKLMPDDTNPFADRVTALETEVCHLKEMVKRLTVALIDTAQTTGYRVRHVKLAREALRRGYLEYRDVE